MLLLACLIAAGSVVRGNIDSDALGVTKRYVAYLPSGYDEAPARRWPVIYLIHGLGANEETWVKDDGLAETADRIGLQAIVVMPDGDRGFYASSATPPDYNGCMQKKGVVKNPAEPREAICVRKGNYEGYLAGEVVRFVDRTYRTDARREARGIAGESAGGFGAFMLAMRHRDTFSAAASHSGMLALKPSPELTPIFGDRFAAYDPMALAAVLQPGQLALYLDAGSEDEYGFQRQAQAMHELLQRRSVEHEFAIGPGKHDDDFFKGRIEHSLRFFARHFEKLR